MSGLLVAAITIIFFKPCAVVQVTVVSHMTVDDVSFAAFNTCWIYLHSVQLGLNAQNKDGYHNSSQ